MCEINLLMLQMLSKMLFCSVSHKIATVVWPQFIYVTVLY